MRRVLFYVDTGGATGGPGMHSVRIHRAFAERSPDLVGPLVVPADDEEYRIFAEQLGTSNVRVLGTSALADPAADPVVAQPDFFARLCDVARREGCDHIHVLWGFLEPSQVDAVSTSNRLPISVTLCDATGRGEEDDVDAMFFGSDRWERYLDRALKTPAGYLAISDKTRRDAIAKGVPQELVETIHLWVDPALASRRCRAPGDYVTFVGGLAEYKGIGHVLDFALAYPDVKIKVAGYPSASFPIEWSRYSSIEYLGYLPYSEVVALIAGARALLYLSYSEGFGLPMIEAQTLGVPLIVNSRNVMVRELLAPGSYVSAGNVASPAAIHAAIQVATRDRTELVHRGLENAARFEEAEQVAKLERAMQRAHARLRLEGWGL